MTRVLTFWIMTSSLTSWFEHSLTTEDVICEICDWFHAGTYLCCGPVSSYSLAIGNHAIFLRILNILTSNSFLFQILFSQKIFQASHHQASAQFHPHFFSISGLCCVLSSCRMWSVHSVSKRTVVRWSVVGAQESYSVGEWRLWRVSELNLSEFSLSVSPSRSHFFLFFSDCSLCPQRNLM